MKVHDHLLQRHAGDPDARRHDGRVAVLSPEVLEHLVIRRAPPALSLNDLVVVAERPWAEQMGLVFEGRVEAR